MKISLGRRGLPLRYVARRVVDLRGADARGCGLPVSTSRGRLIQRDPGQE
jgi:hypothetical protein